MFRNDLHKMLFGTPTTTPDCSPRTDIYSPLLPSFTVRFVPRESHRDHPRYFIANANPKPKQ